MFITKKHISRRAVLRGMGATVALPFLESMLPAMTPAGKPPTRVACLEMVHGSAGSTKYGLEKNFWSPAADGHDFDLTPSSLLPLEPFKDHLTIVSNTDMHAAEAWELHEVGGDHFMKFPCFGGMHVRIADDRQVVLERFKRKQAARCEIKIMAIRGR